MSISSRRQELNKTGGINISIGLDALVPVDVSRHKSAEQQPS
jgi:hypothetical protein